MPDAIETLYGTLAELVAERQDLRERGASRFELERNRRRIVAAQHHLGRALGAHFGAQAA